MRQAGWAGADASWSPRRPGERVGRQGLRRRCRQGRRARGHGGGLGMSAGLGLERGAGVQAAQATARSSTRRPCTWPNPSCVKTPAPQAVAVDHARDGAPVVSSKGTSNMALMTSTWGKLHRGPGHRMDGARGRIGEGGGARVVGLHGGNPCPGVHHLRRVCLRACVHFPALAVQQSVRSHRDSRKAGGPPPPARAPNVRRVSKAFKVEAPTRSFPWDPRCGSGRPHHPRRDHPPTGAIPAPKAPSAPVAAR